MGFPKALLPCPLTGGGETTFVEHLIDVFERSRARPVLVVLGHEADRIRSAVDWRSARPVVNERCREGMLSSIRAGLDALDSSCDGALVCPVDHPQASPEVADRLIRAFEETGAPIVLPVTNGRRGHPVLFSRSVFDELRNAPDGVGARQVVWDHESDLLAIEVSDPGVRVDLDTPAEYRAWLREREDG